MHWILQDRMFTEPAYQHLYDVLVRFNISHSIHAVVPFVGELIPEPQLNHNNVICMGAYSMRHVAKRYGWNPGVFDLEPCSFEVQKEHWGQHMLNYDSVISKFSEAKFTEEKMFIRPIDDSKVFSGKTISKDEFEKWQLSVANMSDDHEHFGDTLIQISPIKTIYSEYRFFIVNQKIITASRYKLGDKVMYSPDIDNHINNFVIGILRTKNQKTDITLSVYNNGWAPHDAYVLDVCETSEGMKIVEINTLNAAGLYACNVTDLVMALEHRFNHKN